MKKWDRIETASEGRKRIANAPIIEIMRNVRMFSKGEYADRAGWIVDGFEDVVNGFAGIFCGIGRILYMSLLYATWPISKPIMSALYRSKFRKRVKQEADNGSATP